MSQFQFIFQSNGTADATVATKKAIRSQAMKRFRQRQRDEREAIREYNHRNHTDSQTVRAKRKKLLPAPSDTLAGVQPHTVSAETTNPSSPNSSVSFHTTQRDQSSQIDNIVDDTGSMDEADVVNSDTTNDLVNDFTNTTLLGIASISGHRLWREQLQSAFLTSYYCDPVISSSHNFISTYTSLTSKSLAMDASRDALALIHLGTRHQDETMLHEGRRIHCLALRLIREDLESPQAVSDDCVLGACYTLSHCEIYQAISQQSRGWRVHMEGLHYILKQRGARSILSPIARAIFHNVRQMVVMDQLLNRRSTFLSSQDWISNSARSNEPAIELTNIALRISTVLEDTDKLMSSVDKLFCSVARKTQIVEIDNVLARMKELENDLTYWLFEFQFASSADQPPYIPVPLTCFPEFKQRCVDLGDFEDTVYHFPSLLSATTNTYVWICLLVLRKSAAELSQLRSRDAYSKFTAAADDCARNLCRSLAFLSSKDHKSPGILACGGPLHWAESWYEYRNNGAMVQWCQKVRNSLERDSSTQIILRPPSFTFWMLPSIL